jgi:hypothetical protein
MPFGRCAAPFRRAASGGPAHELSKSGAARISARLMRRPVMDLAIAIKAYSPLSSIRAHSGQTR